eukprot:5481635-Amphidinium_carterae.1
MMKHKSAADISLGVEEVMFACSAMIVPHLMPISHTACTLLARLSSSSHNFKGRSKNCRGNPKN